jgi:hypothetical protein
MGLLKSIAEIWAQDTALSALMPVARVFTGRVPQTDQYKFPYVSILKTTATPVQRSDKAQRSFVTVSFHIWLDDSNLGIGEEIAIAIENCFPERSWSYGDSRYVIDVLDEGPAIETQVDLATYKAWEVIKLVTLVIERPRVQHEQCDDPHES